MALMKCKECGKEYSKSAKTCPNCGAKNPMKMIIKFVGAIVFGFCVYFIGTTLFSSPKSNVNDYTKTSTPNVYTLDIRPESQKAFEKICDDHKKEYDKSTNEIQKSTARGNRTRALRQQGLSSANNWIGTIDTLSINNDGKGIITIKLNNNTFVSTWNNAFSDIGDNALISEGSNLFKSLSDLKKGLKVRFSGNFFPRDENDYLKTQSITVPGAMSEVKFLMKFTSVALLKNMPFTTEEINLREGPSAETAVIQLLKKGSSVRLLDNPVDNGWVKASVEGKEGYVNSKYLTY